MPNGTVPIGHSLIGHGHARGHGHGSIVRLSALEFSATLLVSMADEISGASETAGRDELGRVLVALGDNDAALDELERAARERSLPVVSLASDPRRGDECVTALVDEIGVR